MLAVLVVLALILYACSGSGSGKKQPTGAGKNSSPAASQSSVPTAGGSSVQSSGGPSSGAPGSSNAPASSGSAPAGSSAGAPSGSSGSAGGPSGSSGGTTGGQNPGQNPGQNSGAPGCQLSLLLTSQSPQYAQGDHPSFTVTALNKGTADCDVDLGPKSLVLNIYSGSDRIWSSADCATGGSDIRGIAPGTAQSIPYTWDRIRSSAGCPGGGQLAKLGMYFGVVNLAPGSGPAAPGAQSQAKTFELKSGS